MGNLPKKILKQNTALLDSDKVLESSRQKSRSFKSAEKICEGLE